MVRAGLGGCLWSVDSRVCLAGGVGAGGVAAWGMEAAERGQRQGQLWKGW